MNIRQATKQDIEQLTELKKPQQEHHRRLFHDNQIRRLQEMKEGKVVYLVGEEAGNIIAHVLIKLQGIPTEEHYPNINDLYVSESYLNKGFGSQLIHTCERIAKEKGFNKISVAVNPTLNPKAQVLYERLGYKRTDTPTYLDGVYDGDEDWVVDMVKDVSES